MSARLQVTDAFDLRGRRLRITHVVVTDEFAGTERYVCDVSRELAARGHRVRVLGGEGPSMTAALAGEVPWAPAPTTVRAVAALTRAGSLDVVHSHLAYADFAAAATWPVHRARHLSTRHILTPRGEAGVSARLGAWVRSRVTEVAVSQFVADSVSPSSDVVVVNGVPSAADAAPDPAARQRVVLLAQRLVPEKRSVDALTAWRASGLAERGWRLWVAGRGDDEARLRRTAADLGVEDSVDMLGWVPDVQSLWPRVSVFLATAPAEPLGLSVLEAMAHEVPVVATDAAGHRETAGSVPGAALYPVGDADACAAHLRSLALDPQRRADYGRALAAAQRERFSITAHVDQLEALYSAPRSSRQGER